MIGTEAGCQLCTPPSCADGSPPVVARGRSVFAALCLRPYNAGHLIICTYRHVADYTGLTEAETADVATFTKRAMRALRTACHAEGFNVGMNVGTNAGLNVGDIGTNGGMNAGAGLDVPHDAAAGAHLHEHVIPRWNGDASFMTVIGHTRILPQLPSETRDLIARSWPSDGPDVGSDGHVRG